MNPRIWITVGALFAAAAVALGAYHAHGLKGTLQSSGLHEPELTERMENFATAARYQMYHALGLVLLGLVAARSAGAWSTLAGIAFVIGVLLFSGLLYALALGGPKILARSSRLAACR